MNHLNADARPDRTELGSRRLWSLWDIMINFQIFGLCHFLRHLSEAENLHSAIAVQAQLDAQKADGISGFVPAQSKALVDNMIQYARFLSDRLQSQEIINRLDHYSRNTSRSDLTHQLLAHELKTLRETFESVLNYIGFYMYPSNKMVVYNKFDSDWHSICDKFPSVKADALAGVDCWAMGQNTASVFHLMRVAERGLRILAKERRIRTVRRNRPLEWADWQDIIAALEKEAVSFANKSPSKSRNAALEFYRGSLASFQGFKDAYRNNVMHTRAFYTDSEANVAREHVFHFMNRLAEKTDETGRRINWSRITV